MNATLNHRDADSPFRLETADAYRLWRARKLECCAKADPRRVFALDDSGRLATAQLAALKRQFEAFNFVLFESGPERLDKQAFVELNRQFGLHQPDLNLGADADRVTTLQAVAETDARAQYIPYSNRAMSWHTDGYYNPPERRINAFSLYCVSQAERGGGNYLFDHEMMYLLIRDQSPELLAALMQDDMMLVPANLQGSRVIRRAQSGPVFSVNPASGALNMRYTSRPQNIVWKSDPRSQRALDLVREILIDSDALVDVRLRAGQGLVCNNILHGRHAFYDSAQQPARLVYRARYHDPVDFDRACSKPSQG